MTQEHSPLPLKAILGTDGRHHTVPIMADGPAFQNEDTQPYHPLVAHVLHGRGHADQKTAEDLAALIVKAVNRDSAFDDLVKALEAIDDFWSEDRPGGPDNPTKIAPGLDAAPLHYTTIAVWKQIRAAIAKAKAVSA